MLWRHRDGLMWVCLWFSTMIDLNATYYTWPTLVYRVFQKCLNRTAKITLAACRLLLLWESCQSGGATHSAVQALMKHSVYPIDTPLIIRKQCSNKILTTTLVFCANNRSKSVNFNIHPCCKTLANIFRPIVYLKTNVVVKILLEHCFLMISAVLNEG